MAGVSHMTVSRVINHDSMVRPEIRKKVMDVIEECDYTPNMSARALNSGETKVMGVLVLYDPEEFPAYFLTTILVGISSLLTKDEYHLSLHFDQLHKVRNLVPGHLLTDNRMDGLFVISAENNEFLLERLSAIRLPIVVVNQQVPMSGVSCIDSDEYSGAYAITTHLLRNGRRRIGFIGGTPSYNSTNMRQRGYEAALVDFGLRSDPALCGVGYFSSTGGREAAKKIIALQAGVDAIFAASDLMAVGAMSAVYEAGLTIPGDIALAGFDDNEFSKAAYPPLTTVRKNRSQMGVEAAQAMLDILARKKAGGAPLVVRKTLPTELVVRESSGSALTG